MEQLYHTLQGTSCQCTLKSEKAQGMMVICDLLKAIMEVKMTCITISDGTDRPS